MVVILGAGAVGTVLAGYLMQARREVKLLVRPSALERCRQQSELRVDRVGEKAPLVTPPPQLTTNADLRGVSQVLVCVKHPDLEAALDLLPRPLPSGLTLVSTLNGVGAVRRLRERFPEAPAVTMTVMFNAQLLGPLHAQITTRPRVLVGSDDPALLNLFSGSGMEAVRVEGEAAAWGKLLINLANAICALTHTTFKDLLTQRDMRVIYAEVLAEAVSVMNRAGVRWLLPMPLPYPTYRKLLLHGGPLPWWLAKLRNRLREGAYPSMVADFENGRVTEVPQLNGEIVLLGEQYGHDTPLNRGIVELIRKVEGHPRPPHLTPGELRARLGL